MTKSNGNGGNGEAAATLSHSGHGVNEPVRDWTVMVYFAADTVDQHAMDNLTRLKTAGSTDEVAFLAQINPPDGSETTWYWLERNTALEEDVVARFSDADAGDPETLVDFVTWAAKAAPAKHYMLILWGHGDGWQSEDNAGRIAGRTVRRRVDASKLKRLIRANSDGDPNAERLLNSLVLLPNTTVNGANSPDIMDGQELKRALCAIRENLGGRKIDILGMDSCMMAMVEVGYQLRDAVDYLVACEDVEPIESWPYDFIFTDLVRHPEMSPLQLGQLIVRKYIINYKGEGRFVTQSMCDLRCSRDLASAIDHLAEKLKGGLTGTESRT
ncbi:MAG: clostripain-related cysteine peptidase, partial [Blastocatellia bacterium]